MKKLILALATVAFIGIGGSAVSAAAPSVRCHQDVPSRATSRQTPAMTQSCIRSRSSHRSLAAPTTVPVTVPVGQLPRTGSGVSPILGIGALLLVGGGIVVVATRRRSTSKSPT